MAAARSAVNHIGEIVPNRGKGRPFLTMLKWRSTVRNNRRGTDLAEYILSRCSTTILAKGTAFCYRDIMPVPLDTRVSAGLVDDIAALRAVHQA
jgi:hypothetical protein